MPLNQLPVLTAMLTALLLSSACSEQTFSSQVTIEVHVENIFEEFSESEKLAFCWKVNDVNYHYFLKNWAEETLHHDFAENRLWLEQQMERLRRANPQLLDRQTEISRVLGMVHVELPDNLTGIEQMILCEQMLEQQKLRLAQPTQLSKQ